MLHTRCIIPVIWFRQKTRPKLECSNYEEISRDRGADKWKGTENGFGGSTGQHGIVNQESVSFQ